MGANMFCENETARGSGDNLEVNPSNHLFDSSATAWVVGQCVRYLNAADKESELAYKRMVMVLRRYGKDPVETVTGLFRQARSGYASLRWSLLYVLGDAGNADTANFLVHTALEPLPEANPDEGCEDPRDMEMPVATMAIYALYKLAGPHPEVAESLLKIVAYRPAQPILIEAVRVANALGLTEKLRELLPKEDQWMLELRRARIEELFAEPKRDGWMERGFTPPKAGALYTAHQPASYNQQGRTQHG